MWLLKKPSTNSSLHWEKFENQDCLKLYTTRMKQKNWGLESNGKTAAGYHSMEKSDCDEKIEGRNSVCQTPNNNGVTFQDFLKS